MNCAPSRSPFPPSLANCRTGRNLQAATLRALAFRFRRALSRGEETVHRIISRFQSHRCSLFCPTSRDKPANTTSKGERVSRRLRRDCARRTIWIREIRTVVIRVHEWPVSTPYQYDGRPSVAPGDGRGPSCQIHERRRHDRTARSRAAAADCEESDVRAGVQSFYVAHYDRDRSIAASRKAFRERVRARLSQP
jgi:hypothetical protein